MKLFRTNEEKKVAFCDMEQGDIFIYSDCVLMKTEDIETSEYDQLNAIILSEDVKNFDRSMFKECSVGDMVWIDEATMINVNDIATNGNVEIRF